ncbi:MAG: helicase-related protein, partial [bacterium]
VSQALAIIEKNNGVIIADVVGLGKTIIACSVAKELKKRGLVICPPGLLGDKNKNSGWKKYLEEFKLYDWEARSLGDLENAAEFSRKAKDVEVIIIDEAHRFRNQDTKDYENLINICRGKIVILLTATPFNNRPGDILALLKLFITPKKSSITLENNLVGKFRSFKGDFERLSFIEKYRECADDRKRKKATAYYEGFFEEKNINLSKVRQRAKYLASQIRDVIEPVTIRRNRLDLKNNPYYKDEVKDLSKIADPKEWFFELTKEQSEFYDRIIKKYFGDIDEGGMFKGAIYRPFEYEVEKKKIAYEKLTEKENFQFIQQRNLYDFMRRLVVKRFESSFGSFRDSIKNFKKITESALEFAEKTGKYVLDRNLLEKIYDKEPEEIEDYLKDYSEKIKNGEYPKNHKIYEIDKFIHKDEFIAHMKADLELFNKILNELEELDLIKNDPKAECMINNLEIILKEKPRAGEPKRKIIIFSEYIDTVKYLEPVFKDKFGERLLSVAGNLSAQKISAINKNFDASYENQEDDFDILLSSDKISEGFNLNRAGMVINYDIPWNPVRVIQRVGRINRISKKVFDELYIVNFFPTEQGAELVKSREIARNKMYLIHNTLGEDAKIFDTGEEPTAAGLYSRVQKNPDKMEEESFYTKALNIFEKIKKEHPEIVNALKKFPPRVKVAKAYGENEMLIFIKKGRMYIYNVKYGADGRDEVVSSTFEETFAKISCAENEPALPLSGHFWDGYGNVKKFKEYRANTASEQSIEQKALNNLAFFINTLQNEELMPHKDFLRILREDILDYGTLSDYTLRRIANLKSEDEQKIKVAAKEIEALKNEIGGDYLEKEKARQKDLSKEIIIAIENRK